MHSEALEFEFYKFVVSLLSPSHTFTLVDQDKLRWQGGHASFELFKTSMS